MKSTTPYMSMSFAFVLCVKLMKEIFFLQQERVLTACQVKTGNQRHFRAEQP